MIRLIIQTGRPLDGLTECDLAEFDAASRDIVLAGKRTEHGQFAQNRVAVRCGS